MPAEPLTDEQVEKLRNHANQVGAGYDTGNLMRRYHQDVMRLLDDRQRMLDRLAALEAAHKVHQAFRDDLWRAMFPNVVQPGDGRECADVVEGVRRLVVLCERHNAAEVKLIGDLWLHMTGGATWQRATDGGPFSMPPDAAEITLAALDGRAE